MVRVPGKEDLPTRNLSQLKTFNQDKCYAESRRVVGCLKGDTALIEDISSTEIHIIDSLGKVW